MAKKKNFWYVMVITNYGPVFVTKVDYSNKTAEWNKLKAPLEMSESSAKDLIFGLNCNMYPAYAVCHPMEVDTQPYRYDVGDFKWEFINDTEETTEDTTEESDN